MCMEMVGSQQGFLGWLSSLLFALHLFFLAYPMLLWARPDAGAIEQVLREEAGKGFTHEGYVRLTRDVRSREELEQALEGKEEQIFDVDHLRIHLGYGQDCFSRAKLAMMAWKMFTVPDWLEICWPHSTIRFGCPFSKRRYENLTHTCGWGYCSVSARTVVGRAKRWAC